MPQRPFSALQRAEIAEIQPQPAEYGDNPHLSVLFNEPKLLKFVRRRRRRARRPAFSALQRAEIAEITRGRPPDRPPTSFQCSSTSRNC